MLLRGCINIIVIIAKRIYPSRLQWPGIKDIDVFVYFATPYCRGLHSRHAIAAYVNRFFFKYLLPPIGWLSVDISGPRIVTAEARPKKFSLASQSARNSSQIERSCRPCLVTFLLPACLNRSSLSFVATDRDHEEEESLFGHACGVCDDPVEVKSSEIVGALGSRMFFGAFCEWCALLLCARSDEEAKLVTLVNDGRWHKMFGNGTMFMIFAQTANMITTLSEKSDTQAVDKAFQRHNVTTTTLSPEEEENQFDFKDSE